MTQEEIKRKSHAAIAEIQSQQNILIALRDYCEHPNTFEGKYSYSVGQVSDAIICSDCGELIKTVADNAKMTRVLSDKPEEIVDANSILDREESLKKIFDL